MYCIIQEIQLKKPNKYGEHKEIITDSFNFSVNGGQPKTKYTWHYSNERFERPIKTAYKISVHESKRVNSVVTKKQYAVATYDYYSIAEGWVALGDLDAKINVIADALNVDVGAVYDCIYVKLNPLEERIRAEYKKTVEYKVKDKHQKVIDAYNKAKTNFAKTYDCDADEYDYCYDIFGELRNRDYFSKIAKAGAHKRSYQRQTYGNYSNYNSGGNEYSSLFQPASGFTADDKVILKKFYRSLSKEYHPDNPGGNTEAMQLLNRLKGSWGL